MNRVWLALQGEGGERPKAPRRRDWQRADYRGIVPQRDQWVGLRTDGLVVVDCDNQDAIDLWLKTDELADETVMRRNTPHGAHFFYLWTPGSPEGPLAGVLPGIDIRAGNTSQVVYFAPGYETTFGALRDELLIPFDPSWLPERVAPSLGDGHGWHEMPNGVGNVTMTSIAGKLRQLGMDRRTIYRCLRAVNQITMERDPMTPEMLKDIARSVSRYEAGSTGDIELV